MKKSYIIGILVIAVAIGIVISTAGDASTYVDFAEARKMATDGDDDKIHVVGQVEKDNQGQLVHIFYRPEVDPNYFEFELIDTKNERMKVVFRNPKPADFERSEQIVIIGNVQKDIFVADKILMKCPSKYTEKEIKVNS